MNAEEIAKVIAEYLNDRDDIGSAAVLEGEDTVSSVGVETQGGGTFFVTVTPA